LAEDGIYGAKTNVAVHQAELILGDAVMVNTFCDLRDAFYDAIVAGDASQERFIGGWKRRSDSFRIPEQTKGNAPVARSESVLEGSAKSGSASDKLVDAAPPFPDAAANLFTDFDLKG
jgi:hypothetical protein